MPKTPSHDIPFIYNLFPRLFGSVDDWLEHVDRAAAMGFNWLFLNPVQLPGESGSLYAVKDYFRLNPTFFPQSSPEEQWERLGRFANDCRERGVEVMVDLVINHTAYDNPLTKDHRNWYKLNHDGSIQSPGAVDNKAPGGYVTWGDLSEIDNANSPDRGNLHEYWWKVVEQFLSVGIRGFRCDAAYQLPDDLWRMLIGRAKDKHPETRFFAESLGCPMEDTLRLARAGHDFTFNSGKWWNYREGWLPEQLAQQAGKTRSICFPESHDTERLAKEWNNDVNRIKEHYLFTAVVSTGVMIVIGFEYGFRKKPHVVKTTPDDWEQGQYDISDFITEVNRMKASHKVLCEDNRIEVVNGRNDNVLAIKKRSLDGKRAALLLFNRSPHGQDTSVGKIIRDAGAPPLRGKSHEESERARLHLDPWGATVIDISPQ